MGFFFFVASLLPSHNILCAIPIDNSTQLAMLCTGNDVINVFKFYCDIFLCQSFFGIFLTPCSACAFSVRFAHNFKFFCNFLDD
uniref:Secreted protein n=1 Tax=Rhipicephalus appendiculatus TaxID=34631 RepID=A0A131YD22_RHIAP